MVIEVNGNDKVAMLMCNTTELAFGPVHKSVRGNAVWLQNLRTPTNRPKGY
jgi:hypothetical protein